MSKQKSNKPTNKVLAGTFGVALTTVVVFILNTYVIDLKKYEKVTPEITGLAATCLTFLFSYLTPPGEHDGIQ